MGPALKTSYDHLLDPFLDGRLADGRPAVGQELVQVGTQAEPISVVDRRQVVAACGEGIEGRLHVADVQVGLGDGQADLGRGRLGLGLTAVGLEQDHRRGLLMKAGLLDRVLGLTVEPEGVGLLLARDVRGDRAFQVVVAQLLEERRPEVGVFQRRGPQPDQRVAVGTLVSPLVGVGHPERQQAEHAARPLEPGQALPLPLEDRQQGRVERVRGQEPVAGRIHVEIADHLLVLDDPVGMGGGGGFWRRRAARTSRTAGGG